MNQRMIELMSKVIKSTNEGGVKWKKTANESAFVVSFSSGSLLIEESKNENGMPLYTFSLVNSSGNLIDSIDDEDFLHYSIDENENWFNEMRDMYTKARSTASGADEIIKSIINEIDFPF
jgi:hypothetical protein